MKAAKLYASAARALDLLPFALLQAARKGHIRVVQALLAAGASANDPEFLLHLAAANGQAAVIQLLAGNGANPNIREPAEGAAPLHWAATEDHVGAIEALLAAGADVNAPDSKGATPLHWAVRGDHVKATRTLLGAGANTHARDSIGATAMRYAIEGGKAGGLLVEARTTATFGKEGVEPGEDAPLEERLAALRTTAREQVRARLESDPDAKARLDRLRVDLARLAATSHQVDVARAEAALATGEIERTAPAADEEARERRRASPVPNRAAVRRAGKGDGPVRRGRPRFTPDGFRPAAAGPADVAADPDEEPPELRARAALRDAAKGGDAAAINRLLADATVSVSEPDIEGNTPLHWAAWNGQPDAIEALLAVGADVHARNYEGLTPQDYARIQGHANGVCRVEQGGWMLEPARRRCRSLAPQVHRAQRELFVPVLLISRRGVPHCLLRPRTKRCFTHSERQAPAQADYRPPDASERSQRVP